MTDDIKLGPVTVAPAPPKPILPVVDNSEFSAFLDTAKFEQAYRIARLFASSQLVPEIFREKPADIFVLLQMAMRMKADPMTVIQNTYIVHGKPGIEAKLAIALCNNSGKFKGPIRWKFNSDKTVCTATAIDRETGEACEAECSLAMASAEKWDSKPGSKWKTMPQLMLQYRSAMFLIRLYAPEVLLGMQSTEELTDITAASTVERVTDSTAAGEAGQDGSGGLGGVKAEVLPKAPTAKKGRMDSLRETLNAAGGDKAVPAVAGDAGKAAQEEGDTDQAETHPLFPG